MSAPHNPDRYGEIWPQHRIDWALAAIEPLMPHVVVSGGYAWHFMSPEGHAEYKHAHDHKDVDLYLPKTSIATVMGMLPGLGFEKVRTKYDGPEFRRYEQVIEDEDYSAFRITLDLFDGDVDSVVTPSGWRVVRPDILLTYYKTHHSSHYCWAVQSATKLLENGETPENLIGRGDLLACPDLPVFFCTKCGWSGQFPLDHLFTKGGKFCPECPYMVGEGGKPSYKPLAEMEEEMEKILTRINT
jgi:hypothetical protein